MTEQERQFAEAYWEQYQVYGEDIPTAEWKKLRNFRERLGISLRRSQEVIKEKESECEDALMMTDKQIEEIGKELYSDDFNNGYLQNLADKCIGKCSLSHEQMMQVYYYKALGWHNVVTSDKEGMEYDEIKAIEEEANGNSLKDINKSIGFLELSEDETIELWICTLFCVKAEILHYMGNHTEAVRLAIRALPYACDEEEKDWAKSLISGKPGGVDDQRVISAKGYGINGRTIQERIKLAEENWVFTPSKDSNYEDNIELADLCCEALADDIDNILHGQGTFSNRPYHDRQFIFTVRDLNHIGGCYDDTDNINYVFPLDELPGEITFPVGHPQANTLYYAHPLRPHYLPFENAQLQLFYEKVHEICRLFQCLGATEITTRCLKGKTVSREITTLKDMSAEGNYRVFNASGAFKGQNRFAEDSETKNAMELTQTFSPTKIPYCPNDLLWTMNDPELQTLIHQRLEGGLLKFSKKVSSFETSNLSQNSITDVKAAFQFLMANVSANYSASSDSTFNSVEETKWEISVVFKPLYEFEKESQKQPDNTPVLKEENLLVQIAGFCPMGDYGIFVSGDFKKGFHVGDEVIISNGKTFLESKIEKILIFFIFLEQGEGGDKAYLRLSGVTSSNISRGMNVYLKPAEAEYLQQNEAIEVKEPSEKTCDTPKTLTKEEEQYQEEILFCLEDDGEISEQERVFLERKRKKLGISEERAAEIEQQTAPLLTKNEQEYLETIRELCTNGIISDRARRLLDRERESLNISVRRAAEIEALANK